MHHEEEQADWRPSDWHQPDMAEKL